MPKSNHASAHPEKSARPPRHTQRAYRADVMAFVKFLGLTWPDRAHGAAPGLRAGRARLPDLPAEPKCRAEDFKPEGLFLVQFL